MKNSLLLIALVLFTLSSYSQSTNIDFYLKLKKMSIGKIEEVLSLNDWKFEGIRNSGDFLDMGVLSDFKLKNMDFSYYNLYTKKIEVYLKIKKFSTDKDHLVLLTTSDFNFYQNLLKNIIGYGYSLKDSYEGKDNTGFALEEGILTNGDITRMSPFVKIYSFRNEKIEITTYKVVKIKGYKNNVVTYENINTEYTFEF